ncbi:hypothetical protein ABZP36_001779 [Zizania latifolia]
MTASRRGRRHPAAQLPAAMGQEGGALPHGQAATTDTHVSALAGFPDHPHRGFETVTYILECNI